MKAKCIKDHYVWSGDNESHKFMGCKKGLTYEFYLRDNVYWLNLSKLPNPDDFLINGIYMPLNGRGLSRELFTQMFEPIDEEDI